MLKKITYSVLIFSFLVIINACNGKIDQYDEYVFAVQLENDSIKVQEYLDYHANIWPEVEEGFKHAGYKNIRLYRFGNYVTMIVQVPKGTDLGAMGEKSESSDIKVKEWNTLMAGYQKGLPGTKINETWVVLDKFYEFNNAK